MKDLIITILTFIGLIFITLVIPTWVLCFIVGAFGGSLPFWQGMLLVLVLKAIF